MGSRQVDWLRFQLFIPKEEIMAKKAAKADSVPAEMKSKAELIRDAFEALGRPAKKERNSVILAWLKEKHPSVDLGKNPASAIGQALKGGKAGKGRKPGRQAGEQKETDGGSGTLPF